MTSPAPGGQLPAAAGTPGRGEDPPWAQWGSAGTVAVEQPHAGAGEGPEEHPGASSCCPAPRHNRSDHPRRRRRHKACCRGTLWGSPVAAGGESSGNHPKSCPFSHPARVGLPAGAGPGRASPAKLAADAGLGSTPFAPAGIILAAGFIGRQECGWRALPARHAKAPPARGCVAGRYGEGLGVGGPGWRPPPVPRAAPGSHEEREVLY